MRVCGSCGVCVVGVCVFGLCVACLQPMVLPDLSDKMCEKSVRLLAKMQIAGMWPMQAITTMFFLFPQNGTSERPLALLPASFRVWEWMRARDVMECEQEKGRGLWWCRWSRGRCVGSFAGDGENRFTSGG